jgi:hypothetical protein
MASPIHGLALGRLGFLVHNERALDIDLDRPGMRNGAVYLGGIRPHAEVFRGSGAGVRGIVTNVFAAAGKLVCWRSFRRHDSWLLARTPGEFGVQESINSGCGRSNVHRE